MKDLPRRAKPRRDQPGRRGGIGAGKGRIVMRSVTSDIVSWDSVMRVVTGAAAAGLLWVGAAMWPALAEADGSAAAVPIFTPDSNAGWVPDRPTGDDFLPPLRGAGPVMSVKDRPYVPNGLGRQP